MPRMDIKLQGNAVVKTAAIELDVAVDALDDRWRLLIQAVLDRSEAKYSKDRIPLNRGRPVVYIQLEPTTSDADAMRVARKLQGELLQALEDDRRTRAAAVLEQVDPSRDRSTGAFDFVHTAEGGRMDRHDFEDVGVRLADELGLHLTDVRPSGMGGFHYRLERGPGEVVNAHLRQGIKEGLPALLRVRRDPERLNYETLRVKHHIQMAAEQMAIPIGGRVHLEGMGWKRVVYALAAERGADVVDVARSPDGLVVWVKNASTAMLADLRDAVTDALLRAQRVSSGVEPTLAIPTPKMSPTARAELLAEYVRQEVPVAVGQGTRALSFAGAALGDVDFTDADLRGIDLSQARINGAIVEEADLREATFEKAELVSVLFSKANMNQVNFNDARLEQCRFDNSTMSNCSFYSSQFLGVSFRGAVI
ncbi:MAG: hypothetical protein ACI9K2_007584, partial [Myxococcota bacterium]